MRDLSRTVFECPVPGRANALTWPSRARSLREEAAVATASETRMHSLEKTLAAEIAEARGVSISQMGLRFDRVVQRVTAELRAHAERVMPDGTMILATLTAPFFVRRRRSLGWPRRSTRWREARRRAATSASKSRATAFDFDRLPRRLAWERSSCSSSTTRTSTHGDSSTTPARSMPRCVETSRVDAAIARAQGRRGVALRSCARVSRRHRVREERSDRDPSASDTTVFIVSHATR